MNAQVPIVQQAVAQLNQDQMRVTSIPYSSTKMVIFSGVPLAKTPYKTNSGKYYVTIKVNPDSIPVQPAVGQHWSVEGTRVVTEVEEGDFVMQQHTYESPEYIECSLPEAGEQLFGSSQKKKTLKASVKVKPERSGSFWAKTSIQRLEKIRQSQESSLKRSE